MRAVKYLINYFFGKPATTYTVGRDKSDPSLYAVFYDGMAIYRGSRESCQKYIQG